MEKKISPIDMRTQKRDNKRGKDVFCIFISKKQQSTKKTSYFLEKYCTQYDIALEPPMK